MQRAHFCAVRYAVHVGGKGNSFHVNREREPDDVAEWNFRGFT